MFMARPNPSNLRSSPNIVDEEYRNALHTKSFVDMYSRVHDHLHLKRSSTTIGTSRNLEQAPAFYDGIPNDVLEPMHESLLSSASRISSSTLGCFPLHLNKLILEFFDATHQATAVCASLLFSIDYARSRHRSIHRLLLDLSSAAPPPSIVSALSSHLELENPLSPKSLSRFDLIHSRYPILIRRLNDTYRKIVRRLKLIRFIKRGSGMSLVTLLGAAAVAAIFSASHGAAVAVAVTPVATGDRCRLRRWLTLEGARAMVDAAAKGAYIVGRDLDTINQMLRRVHDEIEHRRDIARMVVRNKKCEPVMRAVVKEMEGRRGEVGLGFEEQLEELEEHVYLCLISINRSTRLVAREIMEPRHQ